MIEKVVMKSLEVRLGINSNAKALLEKVDTMEFDIFEFKREVEDNELVCLSGYLFSKHALFTTLNISMEKLISFMK